MESGQDPRAIAANCKICIASRKSASRYNPVMATSSPINPYEPPQSGPVARPDFSDRDEAELAELRRRVAELESRVGRSWHFHKSIFLRTFAVWGYLLLGYGMLYVVALPVVLLWFVIVRLVTGNWP